MPTFNGHHIFCNGNPNLPVKDCKHCSRLREQDDLLKFDEPDADPDALIKELWPDAKPIPL